MLDRVTGLMTGYKSNGLGSRPWTEALRLYNTALHSGYETSLTTHAHALDALWRSNDSFQKVHSPVNAAHQQFLLTSAKKIKDEVASLKHLRVAGDEGCNYLESLVKVVAAAGDWESALGVLFDMDATPDGLSHRLLVPTAETFAFAMIACNVKGNATHSYSLQQIFKESYSWRSLHSEVLLTYLQSLRHITRTAPWVGEIVEELVKDGNGLDCPCAIACLQLLSASAVRSETPKARLARTLFDLFDANAYTQQPLARKIELQTLFRCCYVIESREGESGSVMNHIRQYYTSLFGPDSAEVEWIDDTEVYALQSTPSWEKAMEIFERQVMRRPREKVKYLPVPLRQVRWMCCHTLLNCCRSIVADADSDEFLLDDEAHQSETQNALEIVRRIEHFIKVNIHDQDISVGAEALSEIKLLGCLHETNKKKRVATATEAMNELAFAPESSLTPSIIALLSRALEVAELNLTTVVKENHAAFRGSVSALDTPDIAPLEKVYL
ncbi:hypothetical protein AGDE_08188 [Angomonas deanei]|nr:hypothetical protein AGDE_08188 [Angomonas deanei]|eukprot:EPY33629.1 hypothetical protein AGDE_08188 [Angomonas deanei]